tara:strand:- start:584 stop:2170 length:1587 start_codon:yes stop_codon:yes gene_type:complete
MSNCLECGKANPPSSGNSKRKYCSKKCANKYLHKTKRYGCTRPLGWIRKGDIEAEERKQRKAELDACESDPNLFSMRDVAKLGNTAITNVSVRYKKLEITPARSTTGRRLYFSKEQVDQILDYENQMYPKPAGCITTQEALGLLGITGLTFMRRRTFIDLEPEGTIVRNGSVSEYYNKKKVIQFEADWQQRQVDRQEETSQRQKERLGQIQREQKEFEEWFTKETKGLLSSEEFAIACGTKRPPNIIDPTIKVRGYGNYYHPDKVEEYKTFRDNYRPGGYVETPEYGRMPCGVPRRVPLRKDKWTDPRPYVERRLLLEARNYDTYRESDKRRADKFKADADAWKSNGYTNPRTKQCTACTAEKQPFYNYYPASGKCKACCHRQRQRQRSQPVVDTKDPALVRLRVVTAYATTIKHELSKGNKEYNNIPNTIIWDEIEKHLGYSREDLLKHLEGKFEPWMNWTCWGRTRKNKEGKCWEIDHIIPRSTYVYTGINTPEFKAVWSLDNIRPLSRKKNITKSDKKEIIQIAL